MKILVLDDSSFIRKSIIKNFESGGYDFFEAEDAQKAIKIYSKKMPDLVFLDLILKDNKDGVFAMNEMKKIDDSAKFVIITSLQNTDPLVMEAIKLGALDVVNKPFQPEELTRFLEK